MRQPFTPTTAQTFMSDHALEQQLSLALLAALFVSFFAGM